MNFQVLERINPLRKPKGFEPVVQRWSVGFPRKCDALCVAFHGIQGPNAEAVYKSGFIRWMSEAVSLPNGPHVHDHAWFVDHNGLYTMWLRAIGLTGPVVMIGSKIVAWQIGGTIRRGVRRQRATSVRA